jgi:nucleoside-diphosphate-sugar epimerase
VAGETILVAGCGYVGSALAARLVGEGDRVFGLSRSPRELPEGVQPIAADLGDPGCGRMLPEPLDAVFYTAAADDGSEAAYRRAYVDGLGNLLTALEARRRPPRRVLFTSSTSVFHQSDGSWVDEASPTEPGHHRGRVMLEAEARLTRSPLVGVALRLGGIYGPGRTRLLESVRAGRAAYDSRGPNYTNRIHRDDAASALVHLARLPQPVPLYLGVDDDPAEHAAVLGWLARRLGAPEPRAEAGSGPLDAGKRCRNGRLREGGWAPGFPSYRDGYAAMLEGPAAGAQPR